MTRKKESPQKVALREMMGNYLEGNNVKVKDGTNVNSIIMKDMMSIILEEELWIRKWTRNWDISNTITTAKRLIIPEMVILRKPCIPVMAIWKSTFLVIGG